MSTPEAERREQSIAEHVRGLSEESAGLVREQAQLIREDLIGEFKRLGSVARCWAEPDCWVWAASARSRRRWSAPRAAASAAQSPSRCSTAPPPAGLPWQGASSCARTAARATDTLTRDVQAAAEGVRQAG